MKREESETLITAVTVRLGARKNGFPVTRYVGNTAYIEAEVRLLAENILKPGYEGKSNIEKRLPLVHFFSYDADEVDTDGRIILRDVFDKKKYQNIPPLPDTCHLTIYPSVFGVEFSFADSQAPGQPFRTVTFKHEVIADGMAKYAAEQRHAEAVIADTMAKLDMTDEQHAELRAICKRRDNVGYRAFFEHYWPQNAAEQREHYRNLVYVETDRRNTHNNGQHCVDEAFLQQAASCANRTSPQDLGMRFFEMLAFLMRDPASLPPEPPQFTRRDSGRGFRSVTVKATAG